MATSRPKLSRLRALTAKVETTSGTVIAVTGSDGQFNVLNPVMTPDDPQNEREIQAGLGVLASTPGAQGGTLTFSLEAYGNGATGVPAWASTFLPACDWENTAGTFAATTGLTTLTFVLYEDGVTRTLFGARGNFKIRMQNGKPWMFDFEFKGKYGTDADVAIVAPTFPTVIPPVWYGATCSIAGSFTPTLSTVEIDPANEVVLREDATDATGYRSAAIVGRKPTGTMDPESVSVATRAWRTKISASTEESLSITVGSSSNNTITLAATKFQTVKSSRGNRNNLLTDTINFQLNSSSPFTLAFS